MSSAADRQRKSRRRRRLLETGYIELRCFVLKDRLALALSEDQCIEVEDWNDHIPAEIARGFGQMVGSYLIVMVGPDPLNRHDVTEIEYATCDGDGQINTEQDHKP
jgi:hypothetical protein